MNPARLLTSLLPRKEPKRKLQERKGRRRQEGKKDKDAMICRVRSSHLITVGSPLVVRL